MQKFEKYSGLFAEHGDFDIPKNWTVGVAIKPVESFTVAFDVQKIYYSDTESIGNPMLPNLMTARLGDDGGAGFGWNDVTAYKFGLQWAASPTLVLRAGYAYAKQPIPESEVLFNILAPGVIEQHVTRRRERERRREDEAQPRGRPRALEVRHRPEPPRGPRTSRRSS